ncbi:Phosphoribosylformylglycinamidine synthase, PurS subunit [invertebrate metagenome]|uniref:Phosphoribosylformylglycinamidine synthase, PurS subunit n=1 Tax=invertebrate metagenome TaxID=1711999 RepID=A0A484H7A3_9ZZZZ
MKVRIHITLKSKVLDPQGKAVSRALENLGYIGVKDVRQGKYIELDLAESNATKARKIAEQMCRDLLANTVIEDFAVDVA